MGITISRTIKWWKSALAGLILPILMILIFPFILLLTFILGLFGFISITKSDKVENKAVDNNPEKEGSMNSSNNKIEPEKVTSILEKFKEIIIEMKKK
jgi:hypothetical protein